MLTMTYRVIKCFFLIFHLIALDCGWLQVTDIMESETTGKGRVLYLLSTREVPSKTE